MDRAQPQIEVSVVIMSEANELILIRYGWGSAGGLWGLPRTILALHETLAEAVRRMGDEFLGVDILSGGVQVIKEFLPTDHSNDTDDSDTVGHRVRLVYQGVLLAPLGSDADIGTSLQSTGQLSAEAYTQANPGPVEVMLVGLDAVTSLRLESDVLEVLEELDILATDVQVLGPLDS